MLNIEFLLSQQYITVFIAAGTILPAVEHINLVFNNSLYEISPG